MHMLYECVYENNVNLLIIYINNINLLLTNTLQLKSYIQMCVEKAD